MVQLFTSSLSLTVLVLVFGTTVLLTVMFNVVKMPRVFTHAEYADMMFVYGFSDGNSRAAVREYERRFPNRRVPDSRVFAGLRERGTLPSVNVVSERPVQQTLNEVENILQAVERSPTTSSRRIAAQLDIPQTRVIRTVHEQGLYPYHRQSVQHLHEGDDAHRQEFCQWIIANDRLIPSILFTDESTFTRNGINNTRNSHVWADENQHTTVERNFQRRFSVNVWCGIIDDQLIGPVVLDNRLNGVRYLDFLQNALPEYLEDIPLATRARMYFQQDGAPAHYVRPVTQYLNETYPGRWIGRGGVIAWPPRSPDLTPLDYCVWGWLKSEVFKRRVDTREELLARIFHACAQVKECTNELRSATQQLPIRAAKCIEVGGGVFEHVL